MTGTIRLKISQLGRTRNRDRKFGTSLQKWDCWQQWASVCEVKTMNNFRLQIFRVHIARTRGATLLSQYKKKTKRKKTCMYRVTHADNAQLLYC